MWRNKYELYEESVQCPEADVDFIEKEFKKIYKRSPKTLREDFCGTGALLKEWVLSAPDRRAVGIDLDAEPIRYGLTHHFAPLKPEVKRRLLYVQANVLSAVRHKAEVICAFNYSYCIFKERRLLLSYFKGVRKALKKEGLFFLDTFGGTESMIENQESRNMGSFTYYWECESFNPLTHECFYSIHFKKRGSSKKHKRVFTYDWRFWTLPELRDILMEAGFSEVKSYWEGDGPKGTGNGVFKESREAKNCPSWISYLVACP